ncbi:MULTISPECIES: hypothetical protein [Pseudovibrio]|uniref:hypothetical protein n=1 Tax=Stappiaceae TaxID=2821832 RepID=UPI00236503B9|nr:MULTISPECIES: hypothetical protein [Pseudovibrio]MDD7910726.1 hypothetical protein [Pseudovibrio exalbescens]MDX5594435.1 hypothetical protein [Pseudovibrio sp. SPO723]
MAFRVERTLQLVCSEGQDVPEGYLHRGLRAASGSGGAMDLVAAHKWFNIAALKGCREATHHRREISDLMSAAEISEAQRQARQWLATQ